MKKITMSLFLLMTTLMVGQNELTSIKEEYFDGTNWITNYKTEYSYDTNGNVIKEKNTSYSNGVSQDLETNNYTYNSKNRVVEETYESGKTVFTYNSNDAPTSVVSYELENDVLIKESKFELFYNGTKLDYYISYAWNGQEWALEEEDSERVKYIYTDSKLTSITYDDYEDGNWVEGGKDEFSYDSSNRLIRKEFYSSDGDGTYTLEEFSGISYDSNNNIKEETGGYNSSGTIENNALITYNYDLTKSMSTINHPFKDRFGVELTPEPSDYFVNKILSKSSTDYRTTYYYGNEPTASTKEFSFIDFAVYPNPTSTILQIDDANFSLNTVEVYNLLGKKVMLSKHNKLDIRNLDNGVYVLKVQSEDGKIATKRIVKN